MTILILDGLGLLLLAAILIMVLKNTRSKNAVTTLLERRSRHDDRVLASLMDNPRQSGTELSQSCAMGASILYPTLMRLEKDGKVISEWETPEPTPDNPRRRLYWVNEQADNWKE
jgi:hypothetical protein